MEENKLAKEQIQEAIVKKWCPFCEGKDFLATFDIAGRDFCFDKKGNIKWSERSEGIEIVECNICREKIPKDIWKKWFK